jgi:hypothetical protein
MLPSRLVPKDIPLTLPVSLLSSSFVTPRRLGTMAYNLRTVAAQDQERFDIFAGELKRFNFAARSKMDFYYHMAEVVSASGCWLPV